MERYQQISQQTAEIVTKSYSTSFSKATQLFSPDIRTNIYNIYGLVRIADEIVDSYGGQDAGVLLDNLEAEVYNSLKSGYSTNLIVQSFVLTAQKYDITKTLIQPFFASMRTDLTRKQFNDKQYREYIYGSAEVIGLMCLKVFCPSTSLYKKLSPGAQALGAAFQKINFLRDFADDYRTLGRCYFPGVSFDSFNQAAKSLIIDDINADLIKAAAATKQLPRSSRRAVQLALNYYSALLRKLVKASPEEIKQERLRVNDGVKLLLFAQGWAAVQLRRGH